jgi:hypothetical protein
MRREAGRMWVVVVGFALSRSPEVVIGGGTGPSQTSQ